jgi:ectoine hydroxylase-related dioxygenase (phytanoyl-CoA dioxygenase family)
MTTANNVPEASYGILQQNQSEAGLDEVAEQLGTLGYAILDSGYSAAEVQGVSEEFNRVREHYVKAYDEAKLRSVNEFYTIRSPLTLGGGGAFLDLALNKTLLSLLKKLIPGKFILNQQNGVINPPQETYSQSAWHRDLPYQHFVSSKPLAINALFCVDDFTVENGATFVIPASHKVEAFPSKNYIRNNAIQVEAKSGSFIVLDCMVFHAGGFNKTNSERRAVNHLYNIPYFKQQINIPMNMENSSLSDEAKDVLGFNYMEFSSIAEYLAARVNKKY